VAEENLRRNKRQIRQMAGGSQVTSSPLKSRTRPQSPPVNLGEEVKEMFTMQGGVKEACRRYSRWRISND
jgi:hypothetical protein